MAFEDFGTGSEFGGAEPPEFEDRHYDFQPGAGESDTSPETSMEADSWAGSPQDRIDASPEMFGDDKPEESANFGAEYTIIGETPYTAPEPPESGDEAEALPEILSQPTWVEPAQYTPAVPDTAEVVTDDMRGGDPDERPKTAGRSDIPAPQADRPEGKTQTFPTGWNAADVYPQLHDKMAADISKIYEARGTGLTSSNVPVDPAKLGIQRQTVTKLGYDLEAFGVNVGTSELSEHIIGAPSTVYMKMTDGSDPQRDLDSYLIQVARDPDDNNKLYVNTSREVGSKIYRPDEPQPDRLPPRTASMHRLDSPQAVEAALWMIGQGSGVLSATDPNVGMRFDNPREAYEYLLSRDPAARQIDSLHGQD